MRRILLALLLVSALFAFILGYETKMAGIAAQATPLLTVAPAFFNTSTPTPLSGTISNVSSSGARTVRLALPAVDTTDKGALATLEVDVKRGDGSVFLKMDEGKPLTDPETQNSLRTAVDVARGLLGEGTYNYDVYFSISTPSNLVGGASAGAAAAIALIAALNGSKLNSSVLITGTVDANGRIGPVGKILPKAQAVKAAGYQTFLVPIGESVQTQLVENCTTANQGGSVVRQCQTHSVLVNVSDVTGLNVVEVASVADALPYFARND